ncbi:MAG: cytochrome C oxidase subunit IV family protein [Fimbriimonadaceae bacterium]
MAEKHQHHITPWTFYLINVIGLMVLMGATIAISYVDLSATWLNNVAAILIATIKMMMVILVFMGVKWSTRLIKLWAATGFVWLLLMGLTFGDYATREWDATPSWIPNQPGYPTPPFEKHEPGAATSEAE